MSTKGGKKKQSVEELPIVKSLCLIDPLLQFLTKKSGKTAVPLSVLGSVLPGGPDLPRHQILLNHIPELCEIGVLKLYNEKKEDEQLHILSWESTSEIGFPSPPLLDDLTANRQTIKLVGGSLCGSTKTAAKRRLAVLKRELKSRSSKGTTDSTRSCNTKEEAHPNEHAADDEDVQHDEQRNEKQAMLQKNWGPNSQEPAGVIDEELCHEARLAREALATMFRFRAHPKRTGKQKLKEQPLSKNSTPEFMLPRQASYSGSHTSQIAKYCELDEELIGKKIPRAVLKAFGIKGGTGQTKVNLRRLYCHQARAITSAVNEHHTMVCTNTGSGKSLCFLIPALSAAYNAGVSETNGGGVSLIMFPTKALAQDQFRKLQGLLDKNEDLRQHVIPATLDGDCPHEQRAHVAKNCNLILTNPDTLHAAILPAWDKLYKRVLSQLQYVVIDEAHVYSGLFGTHVALILSRLQRLCVATTCEGKSIRTPTFLASSATLEHPEYHMRLLCPIPNSCEVTVLTAVDDGSPRSAKHFFVWNPPLLNPSGESTGSVFHPKPEKETKSSQSEKKRDRESVKGAPVTKLKTPPSIRRDSKDQKRPMGHRPHGIHSLYRRHAADETALLLARAIINNLRCIAFCKTRSIVEWVYERTVAALRRDQATMHLAERVQPYRGGYKLSDRREIEKKLFDNKLLGVVATSALELGVDIGGIQLTLHVGYPTSIASLLQQAGRAGRGGNSLEQPSLSVVVCFASASEQFLWKKPECLLSRGITAPRSFPVNAGIVQGHLLCASKEFPLTGKASVALLRRCRSDAIEDGAHHVLNDEELFGSEETYETALENLCKNCSVVRFRAAVPSGGPDLKAFKAHAFVDKPWMQVSIRSVEPVSFSIVDLSHPSQAGKMDGIEDEAAVLDNLPYSRVFYHAFPGAIILHRGQKYKVISMTRPPPYDPSLAYTKRNLALAAFAKPTQEKYLTRPLSTNTITIVKQMERVDIHDEEEKYKKVESPTTVDKVFSDLPDHTEGSFAGCGIVNSKRTVHGYKKLSIITRAEMSRHDLSLPDMEYDTFGLWIDAEAEILGPFLGQDYGSGVHALSHALLAVAPLFIPCVRSDLECDHSAYSPTRICLFDERAGGSGTCAELWRSLFVPNGLLAAAVDLLENCASCNQEDNDLGCPACLQSGECVKFNQFLSRSAALVIGKRMLKRLERSELYQKNMRAAEEPSTKDRIQKADEGTPRKKARSQALRQAKDLHSARERLFVVGRPSWPTDEDRALSRPRESAD